MKPDREDHAAAPARPRDAGLRDAGLRDAWRRHSLAGGWLTPDDWHSEAVDAVLTACQQDGSLAVACTGLGRSRARAGTGIAETIDDLAALFAVLEEALPVRLVCAVAEGWAEESHAQPARDGCEDPLSGLATLPYLRTRLAEVYREAEQGGTSPADTHRLLVVRLPRRPDPWHRMALAIGVGRDLRAAFPGGETLSMARPHAGHGTGPAIALVPARGDLPLRCAGLRRSVLATFGTQIRMTPLPGRLTEALRLVDELAH
jgi:hypothetical protein